MGRKTQTDENNVVSVLYIATACCVHVCAFVLSFSNTFVRLSRQIVEIGINWRKMKMNKIMDEEPQKL